MQFFSIFRQKIFSQVSIAGPFFPRGEFQNFHNPSRTFHQMAAREKEEGKKKQLQQKKNGLSSKNQHSCRQR